MKRNPFSQVLKSTAIDLRREYGRLYDLFYIQRIKVNSISSDPLHFCDNFTIKEYCANNFWELPSPFRGTCLSLKDFDKSHRFHFKKRPFDFDVNYLVSFCEYSYNLIVCNQQYVNYWKLLEEFEIFRFYIQCVETVIDKIGYMPNRQNGVTDFVPKNRAAIAVADLMDSNLSYKVIEYNHHSMKGDLERKRATLLVLADKLEPQSDNLNKANSTLKNDLFFLFNSINIRHNNLGGKHYKPFVASMKDSEIEQWYDETYQMCLLAFLELEYSKRKDCIKQLKEHVQNK